MLIRDFIRHESASSIFLLFAAALALLICNSPLAPAYNSLLDEHIIHFVNEGLMTIFFLLIGLEIKREILEGELSTRAQAALPVIAAAGGMIVPTLIFYALNTNHPENLNGWAIPVATDIAFAVGVLSLLGKRVPFSLKILLLSLAIADDLGAILIIAFFYTGYISWLFLVLTAAALILNQIMARYHVRNPLPYIITGIFIWWCVMHSGIHSTLAGVLIAFTVPVEKDGDGALERLEDMLHPFTAFFILPLFAFVNAGITLQAVSPGTMLTPLPLGIIAGLFLGKQVGVFSFIWLGTKLGLCRKPKNTTWTQIYGVAVLTGIGFTMSLFIGLLAFDSALLSVEVRLAVFIASLLSAITGYMILKISTGKEAS